MSVFCVTVPVARPMPQGGDICDPKDEPTGSQSENMAS